jgi:hypothetical protein
MADEILRYRRIGHVRFHCLLTFAVPVSWTAFG